MLGVFPNFDKYDKVIKKALIVLIGKFVKTICVDLNKNSWFMKFEKSFDLELILDNESVMRLSVEAI